MDTRSKNIKYSPWVKALCIIISTAMFMICTSNALKIALPFVAFRYDEVMSFDNGNPGFYDTSAVSVNVQSKADSIGYIADNRVDKAKKHYSSIRSQTVENALNAYLDKKSQIIQNELQYVAKNYREDEALYESNSISDEYVESIPDTPADKQKYPVDPYAPNPIKAAQKILNYAEGREFLKYELLVRDEAFSEDEFAYVINDDEGTSQIYVESYDYDSDTAKKKIESSFDSDTQNIIANIKYNTAYKEEDLKQTINIKYFAKQDGSTYTNLQNEDINFEEVVNQPFYYLKNGSKVSASDNVDTETLNESFKNCDTAFIYCVPEKQISGNDEIAFAFNAYQSIDLRE